MSMLSFFLHCQWCTVHLYKDTVVCHMAFIMVSTLHQIFVYGVGVEMLVARVLILEW